MGFDPNSLKVIQLEQQVQDLHAECSRRLNHLIDVQVMLDDDEVDEAREYLKELLPTQ